MLNRIFISADIEGTCGIAHWDETILGKADYEQFRRQMTAEVAAACEGAAAGGSDDILIKDAHDSARNLTPASLPEGVQIFRGWGSDIHSMMSGLDASFAGVIFTGYHSSSNTDANPLSHTMNLNNVSIRINGIQASEMVINTFAAAMYDVPVLMITGDVGVCEAAKRLNPNIVTVPVSRGCGNGSISIHPQEAVRRIRAAAEQAVREGIANPDKFKIDMPNKFDVEVEFVKHNMARRAGFYPGVRQTGARTVMFSSDAYYEVLRFFMFCL
ncbi:MAG: M55 family metallopeptidase [Clostridia bacterium]|nr:M55 family metallopeptidase [Clostridia bacterium]